LTSGPANRKCSDAAVLTAADVVTVPGEPLDSSREARLTVSPHRSKAKRRVPITPATTSPRFMPMRIR
jgi:hypothetical protein